MKVTCVAVCLSVMLLASSCNKASLDKLLHPSEVTLRKDLYAMRAAIDRYTMDKQKAPQSLNDLVAAGYLKFVPKDPVTGSSETWRLLSEDKSNAVDPAAPGIVDVHSGSTEAGSDGTAYNTW